MILISLDLVFIVLLSSSFFFIFPVCFKCEQCGQEQKTKYWNILIIVAIVSINPVPTHLDNAPGNTNTVQIQSWASYFAQPSLDLEQISTRIIILDWFINFPNLLTSLKFRYFHWVVIKCLLKFKYHAAVFIFTYSCCKHVKMWWRLQSLTLRHSQN